jgi:type VI secretion system FHA domain protein
LNILLACTAMTGEACCLKERAKRPLADDVKQATVKDGGKAGALFRRLVAGLVVMAEARARAKAQLGAEATAYNPNGHNPLKFARTPDEAIAALLGPARPGFMEPDAAIEDAYRELQQHQIATLRAMQGALRATLERFSPSAIRARADAGGLLERIMPGARDAALWQAYEREFGGVALGSDEAFLDMFAKEFRRAYDEQATSR